MAGICSGPGPCDVTPLGLGKNWVTKVGGLPLYIRAIAHALRRSGHSESDAIQLAVGTVQRWARGGGDVTDATRGRAAAALAEWERKRAEAHLSGSDAVSIIDLASSITDGMCMYDPQGDERDQVSTQVRAINALSRSGRKTQAKTAMAALVKSKTNRARKMSDGTVRAHSALEVSAGLSKLGAVDLSGGNRMAVDLATQSQLLPDMDAVRKAASKLSKLPPPLRKSMAARLMARAKQLGVTLNLSGTQGRVIDLAVDQAQRDKAKAAGLTFPGTDSFPLAGPDGMFSRALAGKAVSMVQLSNAASAPTIRKWLMSKLKSNGAGDLIPGAWQADGTVKS